MKRPNFLVILVDDLRYDEFGAGGHPYMQTPNIDRLALRRCAVRARVPHDADLLAEPRVDRQRPVREPPRDHRQRRARRDEPPPAELPPGAAEARLRDRAHRQVAHGQRRHAATRLRRLGELRRPWAPERSGAQPRRTAAPASRLHHRPHERARRRMARAQGATSRGRCSSRTRPCTRTRSRRRTARFASPHSAPTSSPTRHKALYKDAVFPKKPNMLSPDEVAKRTPAWAEALSLRRSGDDAQTILAALHSFGQEEIRLRARMMAAVDEGVGEILDVLERNGKLDDTFILFLGRQRLLLRRARARARATLRLRGRHPFAFRRSLSAKDQGGIATPRARHLPGHRADADSARRRDARPRRSRGSHCCRCSRTAAHAPRPAGASRSSASTGPSRRCPGSSG